LEETYSRIARFFDRERILIVTGKQEEKTVCSLLQKFPRKQMVIEPSRKGTASAIGLCLAHLLPAHPDASFVVINSDAHVEDSEEYMACIQMADVLVNEKSEHLILIGVKPTYPETGYGYIHLGPAAAWVGAGKQQRLAHSVDAFFEKPDEKRARQYLISGDYLWNPTLMVARVASCFERLKTHAPDLYAGLRRVAHSTSKAARTQATGALYERLQPLSIDHALLEPGGKMLVIPGNFGWRDVGSWRSVFEVSAKKETDNVQRGNVLSLDGKGNLLFAHGKKLLAVIGVQDLVVVDTDDALLVCPRVRAQEVKKIVEELKVKGWGAYV
jgi:mannose-1-phosphate guanylyltransferase